MDSDNKQPKAKSKYFSITSADPQSPNIAPYIELSAEHFRKEDCQPWTDLRVEEKKLDDNHAVIGFYIAHGTHRRRLSRLGIKRSAWEALDTADRDRARTALMALQEIELALTTLILAAAPEGNLGQPDAKAAAISFLARIYKVVSGSVNNPGGFLSTFARSISRKAGDTLREELRALLVQFKGEAKRRNAAVNLYQRADWTQNCCEQVNALLRKFMKSEICDKQHIAALKRKAPSKVAAELVIDVLPEAGWNVADGAKRRSRGSRK